MKILVVDDNSDDRTLLWHIVERYGHEPIEARDGREGLDMAAAHRPDLIISDALMPVMDGFSFLRRLKEDEALNDIPFIFYSASYQGEEDIALAHSLGACAYIFKPMAPDQLWMQVEQVYETCTKKRPCQPPQLKEHQVELLEKYSTVVASKLEEKVLELERTILLQKETEKRLKNQTELLQNSLDALAHPFYVINVKDYSVALANKNSHFQEWQEGTTCHQLTHGQDKPCSGKNHPCTITEILKNNTHVVLEHIHTDKEGREATFEVHGYPVFGPDGDIVQVIEYCIDITKDKKLKEQLQQAQKMEAIGTLAGGIAHDFNNILTSIIGYSSMIIEDLPEGSNLRIQQEQVLKAGNRAKELVRQILSFSRQNKQDRTPLQIHLVIKEVIKLLRSSIPTTIEIKEKIDPKAGYVLAAPTQIHQIVMNLCTNAYHAMRAKGGIMTISLTTHKIESDSIMAKTALLSPGSYIVLQVVDTGCGISKQTMEKIFEPYFTTKTRYEGTGLGLAMVHGIAKSYGGHVFVESEPGKGSSFQVFIPRIQAKHAAEIKKNIVPPRGTERIMVLDDENVIIEMEQRMLENLGYQVFPFTKGELLLQAFRLAPEKVDLVITDMTMPDLTGVELTKILLGIRPDLPIILCTGFNESINQEKATALGVKKYLMKPVSKAELAMAVREALDEVKSAS